MGYTTEFEGRFNLNKQLEPEHQAYLEKFSKTRRMRRDPDRASKLHDPVREAVRLDVGPEACFFVGGTGFYGQDRDASVIDYNDPPSGQPGLWCQWVPSDNASAIEWNGTEKFYDYIEWLRYLIDHFLAPWGYMMNGEVTYKGEDSDDFGKIVVKDNVVKRDAGRLVYSEEEE